MPATRRFRIVRRAVMALAGVVLLVAWYVASYGALWWYFGDDDTKGAVSPARDVAVLVYDVLYAPLHEYESAEWPGTRFVRHFANWCYQNGRSDKYVSWEGADPDAGFGGGGFF